MRHLHSAVSELRHEVAREGDEIFDRWRPRLRREQFIPSARNLAFYIALRHHDLRDLQLALMPLGLSSLGRCEARVLPSLDAVAASLASIAGSDDSASRPRGEDFFRGHELLRGHTDALLGPAPAHRDVRVMVTMPSEAASSYNLVRRLVFAGMDVARVNCGHDDPATWEQIAAHVRRAAVDTGRSCLVCFDLSGPRSRIASTTIPPTDRLHRDDDLLMTARPVPLQAECEWQFECSLPEAVAQLDVGDEVWVNEGRLGAVVKERVESGLLLQVTEARDKGEHVRVEKGLNFPTTDLLIESLTSDDLRDLDAVAPIADLIGYSFAQRPEDIARLQDELAARGAAGLGMIAKIETGLAVRNLPELIVQGAGAQPFGVMIARGDLAVEIGHRRMAEIQEELLWLCEAAHTPVIWATQVLDNFVKKGARHRAEISDAAMAERAECVMLNKGPYAEQGVRLLDDLLGRMEGHQFKKTSRMRALRSW